MFRLRYRLIFITLFAAAISISSLSAQTGPDLLKQRLDGILDDYRKVIVLLDGTDASNPQSAYVSTARLLYAHSQDLMSAVSEQLQADYQRATETKFVTPPPDVTAFLSYLDSSALHDADKLAFIDLLEEIVSLFDADSGTNTAPEFAKLRMSIREHMADLDSIKNLYGEEVAAIFSRARGKSTTKREKWETYVKFLKSIIKRDSLIGSKGAGPKSTPGTVWNVKRNAKNEISGHALPLKTVLLTFDDGPHRIYTDQLLEILRREGVQACFFQVGKNLGDVQADGSVTLSKASSVAQKAYAAGHLLASHTYSHKLLPQLSRSETEVEIGHSELVLEKVTGAKPELFRPPYGAKTSWLLPYLDDRGVISVMWNIDSMDWADPIAESIAARVIKSVESEKRGVILLHDIHKRSIDAVQTIIQQLKSKGYTFLSFQQSCIKPFCSK